ncbi:MFS transporter [Pseudomonas argentinensis]|uniref:MFS transporter n=1 Tax=Phytopseudomonas argentinensis TaxID=289370 RepID=UPI0008A9AB7E|nr:MFS transporter [Pseudomonas argentinensis]
MKPQASSAANVPTLAALAGAILLASLGTSIATVALPHLATVFSAGVTRVQWVVLAYLLAVTVAIVVAGRLGDLYGNRRVLLAGIALFTLASVGGAIAPSLGWLVAARALQGLGAAVLMALPMSIAKSLIAKARLGAAMGLLGSMSAIGTALGPSLGGLLIGQCGWRSMFVLLALCGAGLLVLAGACVGKTAPSAASARIDWAGCAWLCAALLGIALATTGSQAGIAVQPWALLMLGVVAGLLFIRTELRAEHPLIPVALFRERAIVAPLGMNLLVASIMMSTLVVGPLFLAFGLGLSEAGTGLVMAAGPVAAALSGAPAGRLTDRFGTDRVLLAGLLLAALGLCGFAVLPGLIGVPGYLTAMLLMTPGFQLFLAANNTALMNQAAEANRGVLSGLLGLSRNLGLLTGAALLPLAFASLLDGTTLADNSATVIGNAFSMTFLGVAGLCFLTLLFAARGRLQACGHHPI